MPTPRPAPTAERASRAHVWPHGLVVAAITVPSDACAGSGLRFDGTSLPGWHEFTEFGSSPTAWAVEDGAITRVGDGDDLVTDKTYAGFESAPDWKLSPSGHSRVIYRIDPAAEGARPNASNG